MKLIYIESDLHAGSRTGLLPPNFKDENGNVLKLNDVQAELYKRRRDALQRVVDDYGKPDFYFVNGDLIDGPQPGSRGRGLSLQTVEEQVRAAKELIQEGIDLFSSPRHKCETYVMQGTDYHESPEQIDGLAESLGAVPDSDTGLYTHRHLMLNIEDVILDVFHDIGFSSAENRHGALIKERNDMQRDAGRKGEPLCDVLIRSHCHSFLEFHEDNCHALITPCWQFPSRYATKKSPRRIASYTSIGALLLQVDGEAKRAHERCSQVIPIMYQLPKKRARKA